MVTSEDNELNELEDEGSSTPAKKAKKSDDTETRFSKLLGEIFNNSSTGLPQ